MLYCVNYSKYYYTSENGKARKFVDEMIFKGIVDRIRNEEGNIHYEYFYPINDKETVLLIDSWKNQKSLDIHHKTSMMNEIIELRNKYDLHMRVEHYISDGEIPEFDQKFIKE